YLEVYQATHEDSYRDVAEQTLAWVRREMTSPEGPFYSTLDADSEGVEGKFYVWRLDEVEQVLGKDDTKLFATCYGVKSGGNWSDPHDPGVPKNILHRTQSFEQLAAEYRMTEDRLRA